MHRIAPDALAGALVFLGICVALANACSATEETTTGGDAAGDPSGTSSAGGGGSQSSSKGSGASGSAQGAAGPGGSGQGGTGQGGSGAGATGPGGSGQGGAGGSSSASTSGSGGLGGACAATSAQAEPKPQPADIVIAVDTSGSMDQEAGEVQQNLNNFASIIINSGIDVHVVLIADSSVCIAAPLGSGNCPADENLPIYRHVLQTVDSNDSLDVILNTYPQWKPSLRANASKTIAVVTDDNASMSANTFNNSLLALDPPTFQGYKFDAIYSYVDPVTCVSSCLAQFCVNCGKCCPTCNPLAANQGTVYQQLVQMTAGVSGDLCDQDFDPMFQDMATSVVMNAQISCEYDIPPPPMMMMLDPNKVNVQYTPGMGMPQIIPNVPTANDCTNSGGWYYDNPAAPTKVILCPATCTTVQADPNAKMDVQFGCDTIHM